MIGSTYRVQFRTGFGFDDAAQIVPHLKRVGITHMYASPIFEATTDSTHGYDVTDHNTLDEVLGGMPAFERLSAALSKHGLGLILDIVPNHMAANFENPWWRDVVKNGPNSKYAKYFDIDWEAGNLVLPILGKPFGEAVESGDLKRKETPEGVVLEIPGAEVPVAPGTEHITDVVELHEAQHYRLAHWRIGRDGLTYRRFFEVTGLVGVRVEDPDVFDDVHALILRLVREGKVHGLRVDHVDGLADPSAYLKRLAEVSGVPILVEKILGADEVLRPGWPILGTTGYEFIAGMAALFTSRVGLDSLTRSYGEIADADVGSQTKAAKRQIITENLAGELERLTALVLKLFEPDLSARDHGAASVREGLVALMMGLDVYRTYLPGDDPEDRAVLERAKTAALADGVENPRVLDDLIALLLAPPADATALELISRLQQTSGPLMAKAVEDTLFYRHHRLLALNEVGGELEPQLGAERYLRVGSDDGLGATQTHDTKRGEDSRARLYALSEPEAADVFGQIWRRLPGEIPDKLKWALAQMLFGAYPLCHDPDLPARFREAALKVVREAKEETSWTRPNEEFEAAVGAAAEAMTSRGRLLWPLAEVRRAGAVIGCAQALLKCIARPAPDIYQGTLGWDLSMVDPDNRRPVDYAAEDARCVSAVAESPDELVATWQDGRIKARVVIEGLAARRERPALFAEGTLEVVPLTGAAADDFFAVARRHGGDTALAIVPLRPLRYIGQDTLALDSDIVGDLAISLPAQLVDRLTGAELQGDLAAALAKFPLVYATSWPAETRAASS